MAKLGSADVASLIRRDIIKGIYRQH
ncbi:MAG TPA: regulator, partial [Roseovarius nubinhibens]|nr:regulator [Roseovarius nubinhibens]